MVTPPMLYFFYNYIKLYFFEQQKNIVDFQEQTVTWKKQQEKTAHS